MAVLINKKEFELKKAIIELEIKMQNQQHINKMEELKYIRDTNRIQHENEMERIRIKTAEIKRTIMMRDHAKQYEK